jgi:hypothetical protein
MKMEQTQCSKTSAIKHHTLENNPICYTWQPEVDYYVHKSLLWTKWTVITLRSSQVCHIIQAFSSLWAFTLHSPYLLSFLKPHFLFLKLQDFSNHLTAYTVQYYVTQPAGISGNAANLWRCSECQLGLLLSWLLFSGYPQCQQENAKTNGILPCPFHFVLNCAFC